jgi:hypothetical protein
MSQGLDFLLGCHVEVDRAGRFGWRFLLLFTFRLPQTGLAGGIRCLYLALQS